MWNKNVPLYKRVEQHQKKCSKNVPQNVPLKTQIKSNIFNNNNNNGTEEHYFLYIFVCSNIF